MQKLKRIAGILVLLFCGLVAIGEFALILVIIEQTKDWFSLLALAFVAVVGFILFLLVRFSLRLLNNNPIKADSIDKIGKE